MTDPEVPAIRRPIARGAGRCHVLAVRVGVGTHVSVCDVPCGHVCGEETFDAGMTRCPVHDEPLSDLCRAIIEAEMRTGAWEGVESDPHHGTRRTRRTPCLEPDCPELVLVGGCWCWEHINVCADVGCPHPAHRCEEPVHFCERHGGPAPPAV